MLKQRKGFVDSEEGKAIKQKLQLMTTNSLYNTASSYSTNSAVYPDNLIPFVDKHMNYLVAHPQLESSKYFANLQMITRVR
jgi:hypothetical protein